MFLRRIRYWIANVLLCLVINSLIIPASLLAQYIPEPVLLIHGRIQTQKKLEKLKTLLVAGGIPDVFGFNFFDNEGSLEEQGREVGDRAYDRTAPELDGRSMIEAAQEEFKARHGGASFNKIRLVGYSSGALPAREYVTQTYLVSGVSAEEYPEHRGYAKHVYVKLSEPSLGLDSLTRKHESPSEIRQREESAKLKSCEWKREEIIGLSKVVSGIVFAGLGLFLLPLLDSCPECLVGVGIPGAIIGLVVGVFVVGPYVGDALAPNCNKEIFARTQSSFGERKQQLVQRTDPAVLIYTFRW